MTAQDSAGPRGGSRFGVDIGGTFTDFVYYDGETEQTRVAKVLTTASAPEQACIQAVTTALSDAEIASAAHFVHGTTAGLNALIQRTGAKVGLLVTHGFRDILEVARASRLNPFSLRAERVRPLVPRRLSLPVRGRMNYLGEEVSAFERQDVETALKRFAEHGVTAIAVSFLHAYANPAHELMALRTLRELGFKGPVTLSHTISGEHREYERTSTAVIDAFVRNVMSDYLARLDESLRKLGFGGTSLMIRSGGGAMTFQESSVRSFETIMSGPVGGAQGAAEVANKMGIETLLTADVGGTSFDTCLVTNGRPSMLYEGSVEGLPLQAPWVDIHSIGAGGGSIAYLDPGGLMKVGPESAGANPGPACYDRGGLRPTLTDAECVLGMFGAGVLASGLVLRKDLAEKAVGTVSDKLGHTPVETARGIVILAVTSMANAIREITVGNGVDPRTATILAFGGAGPVIADLLARELQIKTVVVPPHAGNFSAWGMLGADIVRSSSRTRVVALKDEDSVSLLNELIGKLMDEIDARSESRSGSCEVCLDMRYAGQENTTSVVFPLKGRTLHRTVSEVTSAFIDEFARVFKSSWDGGVEVVSTRVVVRQALPARNERVRRDSRKSDQVRASRVFSFVKNQFLEFKLVDREDLAIGYRLPGPAIIAEPTTTTYVDLGTIVTVHDSGSLVLKIGDAP